MATVTNAATLFDLVSSETVTLTPEVAKKFRDMPASPTERTLTEKRVQHLKEKIAEGLFLCPTWATVEVNGVIQRMNGNHSSNALCIAYDENIFPEGLQVHIDHYKADSIEGVAQLFRQFDDRVSGRSALDISGAYQGLYPEINHVDRVMAQKALKGVSWFKRQVMKEYFPKGDDLGKAFENRSLDSFIEWYAGILTSKTPELKTDYVAAAMYGSFESNEAKARKFWFEVSRGANEDGATAIDMLAAQLLDIINEKRPDKKLKPMQVYGICVKAWNCYLDGNSPKGKFTQPPKKSVPEIAS